MATQILSQAATFPKPAQEISQAQLSHIIELRRQIEALEADLKAAEAEAQAALTAGRPVEPGLWKAWLRTTERRSVPWKQVVERELGQDYAKRVLAATKPETYTHLVVSA